MKLNFRAKQRSGNMPLGNINFLEQKRKKKDFVDKGVVYVVISDLEHTPEAIRKYLDVDFLKQAFPEELSSL